MDADFDALAARAEGIPSLGGRKLAPLLRELAASAPPDTSIVEVGSWLGAGTAQLALGMTQRSDPAAVELHCYDLWIASRDEVRMARERGGVRLRPGQNLLPFVRRTLEPFGVPIVFHQGDIFQAEAWGQGTISVFVDDASKRPAGFMAVLTTFIGGWAPGVTVLVLMDYLRHLKTGDPLDRALQDVVEANPDSFEPIDIGSKVRGKTATAAFRFIGPIRTIPFDVASPAIAEVRKRQRWSLARAGAALLRRSGLR